LCEGAAGEGRTVSILDYCKGAELRDFPAEAILIAQGTSTGVVFVLVDGRVAVVRDGTEVAAVEEPGAIFGEMSMLLGVPHTATVRAASPVKVYAFSDAEDFLRLHPSIALQIAKLLAQRLNAATTYLVDLKRQFEHRRDHLGIVGEVLDSLMNQQRDEAITPVDERPADPRL
jgi:CRP-like cAMP-binding protein